VRRDPGSIANVSKGQRLCVGIASQTTREDSSIKFVRKSSRRRLPLCTAKRVVQKDSIPAGASRQDALYEEAASGFGAALGRLARAYEADPDKRNDLLQEIHFALWRSFANFDGRCSLRTWVYRVAHNAATSHIIRQRRTNTLAMVSLEDLENLSDKNESTLASDQRQALDRLLALIQRLKPLDRQVIISYLEGMDAASIGDITGISAGNAATKIHRIKSILARRFHEGGRDDE
jgi:RNA polymerase sigma-70 factor (ECF subfamily)